MFLVKFIGGESEINNKKKKAEFYDWRWTDPLELAKLIVPFKRKLYEEIIEEFKTYFYVFLLLIFSIILLFNFIIKI